MLFVPPFVVQPFDCVLLEAIMPFCNPSLGDPQKVTKMAPSQLSLSQNEADDALSTIFSACTLRRLPYNILILFQNSLSDSGPKMLIMSKDGCNAKNNGTFHASRDPRCPHTFYLSDL